MVPRQADAISRREGGQVGRQLAVHHELPRARQRRGEQLLIGQAGHAAVLGQALAVEEFEPCAVDPEPGGYFASWWKVSRNSRMNSLPSSSYASSPGS